MILRNNRSAFVVQSHQRFHIFLNFWWMLRYLVLHNFLGEDQILIFTWYEKLHTIVHFIDQVELIVLVTFLWDVHEQRGRIRVTETLNFLGRHRVLAFPEACLSLSSLAQAGKQLVCVVAQL